MKLYSWANDVIDVSNQDERQAFKPTVNSDEVYSIQREIYHASKASFDCETSADEISHQAADGRKPAQGNQRSSITIDEGFQRTAENELPNVPVSC